MKRDMDLVRAILLTVEESESSYVGLESIASDDYPMPVVGYHVELMKEHGLVDADLVKANGGMVVRGTVKALTWDGHDYLDAIRDDRVWQRTKRAVKEAVGDTTMSVIKQTASLVAMQLIKANLGV